MNILKGIGRWTCVFFMSVVLSAWILTAVLQTTILNRTEVKSWLTTSGVYDQALSNLVQVSNSSAGGDNLITGAVLQNALNKTFPPSYLQQNTNMVIDSTYDWLEGKSQKISFSIPVQQKSAEFSSNLAAELLTVLSKLPQCPQVITSDSNNITCIPRGMSYNDYAKQLAQPASGGGFLNQPITQDTLGSSVPAAGGLPQSVQAMQTALWSLPIVWAVLGAIYVLLSANKLRGVGVVGQQAAIASILTLVCGLLLWFGTASIDLSSVAQGDTQQLMVIKSVVNPLARTILPDVGRSLSLFSGIVFGIGMALWLGSYLVRRKLNKDELPTIPPAAPREAHLPPANRPETKR